LKGTVKRVNIILLELPDAGSTGNAYIYINWEYKDRS
jgi:hypothetical protein